MRGWRMPPCPICGAEQGPDGRRQHDLAKHDPARLGHELYAKGLDEKDPKLAACSRCGGPILGKKATARYCSATCRKQAARAAEEAVTDGPAPLPTPSRDTAKKCPAGGGFSGPDLGGLDPAQADLPGTLAWERRQRWLALTAPLPESREPEGEWVAKVERDGTVRHVLGPAGSIKPLAKGRPWTRADLADLGPNLRAFVLDRNPQARRVWTRESEGARRGIDADQCVTDEAA